MVTAEEIGAVTIFAGLEPASANGSPASRPTSRSRG